MLEIENCLSIVSAFSVLEEFPVLVTQAAYAVGDGDGGWGYGTRDGDGEVRYIKFGDFSNSWMGGEYDGDGDGWAIF